MVGPGRRWVRDDSIPEPAGRRVVSTSGGVTGDTTLGAEAMPTGSSRASSSCSMGLRRFSVTSCVLDVLEHERISSEPDQRRLT